MKTPTAILVSLLATAVLDAQQPGAPANSQPLATMHFFGNGGVATIGTGLTFSISYFGIGSSPLFANVIWTPGMVGQSFYDTTGSEPGYGNFISLLTDGTNETVGYTDELSPHGGGGGLFSPEPISFATHPSGWNGVDLQGYSITGLGLRLNQLSIVSPGSNPNKDGNWTDFTFDATFTIYTVPEPADLFPVAIATICAARFWRGCRKRDSRPSSKL